MRKKQTMLLAVLLGALLLLTACSALKRADAGEYITRMNTEEAASGTASQEIHAFLGRMRENLSGQALDEYAASLTTGLLSLGVPENLAPVCARVCVEVVCVNLVASIVVLLGRLLGVIHVVSTITDKAVMAGCGLFLGYAGFAAYLGRETLFQLLDLLRPASLVQISQGMLRNPMAGFLIVVELVILVPACAVLFSMLKGCILVFICVFQQNIQANHLIRGILLSFYEMLSGLFWLAAIACVFSIGIAIILLPIMFVLASLHGSDTVIYIEED